MTTFSSLYGRIQDKCFDTSTDTLDRIKDEINRKIAILQERFRFDTLKLQDTVKVVSTDVGDAGTVTLEGWVESNGKAICKKETLTIEANSSVTSSYVWLQIDRVTQSANDNAELSITTSDDVFTLTTLKASSTLVVTNLRKYKPHPTLSGADDTLYLPEVAKSYLENIIVSDVLLPNGDTRSDSFYARAKEDMKNLGVLYPHYTRFSISEETYSE